MVKRVAGKYFFLVEILTLNPEKNLTRISQWKLWRKQHYSIMSKTCINLFFHIGNIYWVKIYKKPALFGAVSECFWFSEVSVLCRIQSFMWHSFIVKKKLLGIVMLMLMIIECKLENVYNTRKLCNNIRIIHHVYI